MTQLNIEMIQNNTTPQPHVAITPMTQMVKAKQQNPQMDLRIQTRSQMVQLSRIDTQMV